MNDSFQLDGLRVAQARAALTEAGKPLSQAAFAALMGLHPVTMNRIENNKARVSLTVLERIAAFTGCSRAHLLGGDDPVDEVQRAREKFATAMEKISDGFEGFVEAVDLLTTRAGETALVETASA